LGSTHNAIGTTGNDHEPRSHNGLGELVGQLIIGIVGGSPCRSKNAYFLTIPIPMEYTEGMAEFFDRAVDDFDIQEIQLRLMQLQQSRHELSHECGMEVVFRTIE
jgi:hypothetical protein